MTKAQCILCRGAEAETELERTEGFTLAADRKPLVRDCRRSTPSRPLGPPNTSGDPLSDQMIRGEIIEEKLPNGMTRFYSKDIPALPRDTLERTAGAVREILHSA